MPKLSPTQVAAWMQLYGRGRPPEEPCPLLAHAREQMAIQEMLWCYDSLVLTMPPPTKEPPAAITNLVLRVGRA